MDAVQDQIWELADRVAREIGCEVIEVELVGVAPTQVLRVFLDRLDKLRTPGSCSSSSPGAEDIGEAGLAADKDEMKVGTRECAVVSRRLGDVLEAHEALLGSYVLEVSSPGINRPLRRPEHFLRYVGERVSIRMIEARDGQKNYVGILAEVADDVVVMQCDGREVRLVLSAIDKARLEGRIEKERPRGRTPWVDRRRN